MSETAEQQAVEQLEYHEEKIPGILLPVQSGMLLLPGVSVAEVVEYIEPVREARDDLPDWYLGKITWRLREVPLVEFETLNGEQVAADAPHQWVAVLNNTGVDARINFIAIVLRGLPRLVKLTADNIGVVENDEQPLGQLESMRVVYGQDQLIGTIPDVAAIERAWLALAVDK